VVPQLVPKSELGAAVAANSVGVNVSRAIGPALGGVIIGLWDIAAPFWINAASNLGVIVALFWWRPLKAGASELPAESFSSAMRVGLRHARYNANLRATLMRAVGFFLFASAYWALLPLVARSQIGGGPELYGLLLGAIGNWRRGRSVRTAPTDRSLRRGSIDNRGNDRHSRCDGIVRRCSRCRRCSLRLSCGRRFVDRRAFPLGRLRPNGLAGLGARTRPRGLRDRTVGSMTLGSVIWGQLAGLVGLPQALFIAAAGRGRCHPFDLAMEARER